MWTSTVSVTRYCFLLAVVQGIAAAGSESASPARAAVQGTPQTDDDRLPRDTEPLAYGLRLVPSYDKPSDQYQFGGQVEILIKVNEITPNVTLNARDMVIKSVAVTEYSTQTDLEMDAFVMVPDEERLVISTTKNLLAGRRYQVKIVFQGMLRTDMTGFYRSVYKERNNTMWMAVTNFKPTFARRAFPCYDEPTYKTPFNISLGRQPYQMSLSNMPLYMSQRLEYYGWWLDSFETTPPIPTYLVGGFVGVLKKSEHSKETNVNVYGSGDHLNQTGYAMEEAPTLFQTMDNYTTIPDGIVKMDFVGIPEIDGEGLEIWGMNLYREKYLFIEDDSKTKFKELSTMVMQQLQSNQWFGNLVTCSWWNYPWLNEGFARYFRYYATETVKSDWRLEEMFVVEQHQTALAFDQVPRHSMTASVKSTDDIQSLFDHITYNKAAAVLRMIRNTVSENNFHEPLKLYLKNYRNAATSPSILWSVFENFYFDIKFQLQEDVSFTDFVHTWTDQSGYPVINVTWKNSMYTVTQQRFSVWPSNDNTTKWYFGVTYTNNTTRNFNNLNPVRWMKPTLSAIYIRDPNPTAWFIFNLQSSGFYRVNYDSDNWKHIVQQLNVSYEAIPVLNRAQLIDDSFNLARASMLEYSTALDLSMYLKNEEDQIPWYTAINCLTYVVERMRRSPYGYDYIKSYVRDLATLIYQKTEDSVLKRGVQDHVTLASWNKFSVWACSLDSKVCTENALKNFYLWSTGTKISPDIKDAVLCTGIRSKNSTESWMAMFNLYVNTQSGSEKDSAQTALTCTPNTVLLYQYLGSLFDSDKGGPVHLQDFKDICAAMSLTPEGIDASTTFLMNNIAKILKTMLSGESIVTYMYRVLASKVALDSEIKRLYDLKNATGLPPTVKASFDESFLIVEQNVRWYNLHHATINQWTGAPNDPPTEAPTTLMSTIPTTLMTTAPTTVTSPASTTLMTSQSPVTNSTMLPVTISTDMPVTNSTVLPVTNSTDMPVTNSSMLPVTISTDMPVTNSTDIPVTNSPMLPVTNSTDMPVTNSTDMPVTNSTDMPVTNSPMLPVTNSTDMPVTNSTNMPVTNSTNMPVTNSTNMPVTNSTNMPVTNVTGYGPTKFDFDHTTPVSMSRCPNSTGVPLFRASWPVTVVVTATALFVLIL
ncbi:Hypothetical protein CINCED_3A003082 [Cinara cedri]|nr:Hypothetical protein CINCED_3A003082 [Cinara cedri]